MSNEELHQQILDYIHELYITKNNDYGNSAHDTYTKYGLVSYLIRLEDKLNRARTLTTKERKVADERLEDTLIDLANYAILAVMELRQDEQGEE